MTTSRTPVETLQAAIEKLERLQEESSYVEFNGWLAEPNPGDTSRSWLEPRDDLSPITNDPLVVTLHRTIDAQLRILAHAIARLEQSDSLELLKDNVSGVNAGPLALADAILGEDS